MVRAGYQCGKPENSGIVAMTLEQADGRHNTVLGQGNQRRQEKDNEGLFPQRLARRAEFARYAAAQRRCDSGLNLSDIIRSFVLERKKICI